MEKDLTNSASLGYDVIKDKCTNCGHVVALRKKGLVVGGIWVKCPGCKKWVHISDINIRA